MPFGDLTVSEGTLVGWRKAEGESVAEGELVAEIETDKSVMEIEAPCAGILARIDQPVGAVVAMGSQIGSIRRAAEATDEPLACRTRCDNASGCRGDATCCGKCRIRCDNRRPRVA
ncbi:MAG: lipoyl domain-containing protein [Geminicoccaceae bacterium]